ncbi:uncharacterized protein LOC135833717 [Planococcus citri]|uniref:uncharacterized protein LOC135833717 n=1 Tax=Planococcus citri TaxID=170843 RepID=UPI0031F9381D
MDIVIETRLTEPVYRRSQYHDVMVKVDDDVYYLDKFQLASKSDYFEKLLIEYSNQQECISVTLSVIDTETFSTIADIIYGQSLKSVLHHNNYVELIMAMDYLQMEIDLETCENVIKCHMPILHESIFKLYYFVRENPNLQCLLPSVFEYLSIHLADMRNNKDFSSLPVDHILQIILRKCTRLGNPKTTKSDVLEVCQVCSEWICAGLENRLPHVAKLVNAVKRRFFYMNGVKDDDCNTMLSEIAEKINPEMMTKIFYKFLMCNGDINPVQNLNLPENRKRKLSTSSEKNQRKKLAKLVEKNYFYDVVVNVEEKTYKLHRFILNSASCYFAEIFSTKQSNSSNVPCAEVSTQQPNKIETYSLHDVDQATFDMIIEYLYFDELQLTLETITRVLRAANFLKMKKLFNKCVSWMREHIEEVCAKVLIIDECMSTSWIVDNIEEIVSRFLTIPDTDDTLVICLITFEMLEDLLLSSTHCCVNPHQIVDACSKWIFHDVKNRYHLIPEIALAINRNRNYYKIETPTDLINCSSEQPIRDELWKILNCTKLIPSTEETPNIGEKKKCEEVPVFVALSKNLTTIHVLNADLDEIASLCLSELLEFGIRSDGGINSVAATLLDDNLFVMFSLFSLNRNFLWFGVYNLSLKKFISLNNSVDVKKSTLWSQMSQGTNTSSLLNCRGQVYCCFKQGHVLKYSMELNRWMMLSDKPVFSDEGSKIDWYNVWFTSDGNKLYRLYANNVREMVTQQSYFTNTFTYVVEEFDFQQNVWLSLSDTSFTQSSSHVRNFTIIGRSLAVILTSRLRSFDRNSRRWREFPLVNSSVYGKSFLFTQFEDRLLHLLDNKLYECSQRNQTWQLKKEIPVCAENRGPYGPYACISAVHRHKQNFRTD